MLSRPIATWLQWQPVLLHQDSSWQGAPRRRPLQARALADGQPRPCRLPGNHQGVLAILLQQVRPPFALCCLRLQATQLRCCQCPSATRHTPSDAARLSTPEPHRLCICGRKSADSSSEPQRRPPCKEPDQPLLPPMQLRWRRRGAFCRGRRPSSWAEHHRMVGARSRRETNAAARRLALAGPSARCRVVHCTNLD